MAVSQDIWLTYRGPSRVVSRLWGQGRQEVRALLFVLIACLLIFVAQAPYQAREAFVSPEPPLEARLYWSAFLWIFVMPLLLYGFSALIWILTRLARLPISGYAIRLTLFWALLASAPMFLLMGLVAGFIGPGVELSIVSLLALAVFVWFWIGGLIAVGKAD